MAECEQDLQFAGQAVHTPFLTAYPGAHDIQFDDVYSHDPQDGSHLDEQEPIPSNK